MASRRAGGWRAGCAYLGVRRHRQWPVRRSLLRLFGLWAPTSPLDTVTIPCLGMSIADPALPASEGFVEAAFCDHRNNRCWGSTSLLLKIVPGRKEVARANSRF